MTLLFSDGFDRYGAAGDLDLRYLRGTTAGPISYLSSGGVNGGGAVEIAGTGTFSWIRTAVGAFTGVLGASDEFHCAFWMKCTDFPPSTQAFFGVATNQDNLPTAAGVSWAAQVPKMRLKTDGAIEVTDSGGSGTTLATSAAGTIVLDTWHHVEVRLKIRDSGGIWQVWVDRILVIDFSGDNNVGTQPTSFTGVGFACPSTSYTTIFEDLIVWDIQGSDFAHTQLPNAAHLIETLGPDGDSSVQFTRSAGSTNYETIDETAYHNGDTDYVESGAVGHEDLYSFADQSLTPLGTFALALHTRAKRTDVGSVTLRHKVKHGATTGYSGDLSITGGYAHQAAYWGKNPDTSAVWGATDVNAVQAGFKHQA